MIYLPDLYLSTTNKLGYHAPPLPFSSPASSTLYLPSLPHLTSPSLHAPPSNPDPPALPADLWYAKSRWGISSGAEDMWF